MSLSITPKIITMVISATVGKGVVLLGQIHAAWIWERLLLITPVQSGLLPVL